MFKAILSLALSAIACPPVCDCKWKSGKDSAMCVNGNFSQLPKGIDPNVQLLDLSENPLSTLGPDVFANNGLVNLQKLFLRKCKLRFLDKDCFNKLINLVELDLSLNALNAIPSHTFKRIVELRELRLNGNPIIKIGNEAFASVPQLVKLELSECRVMLLEKEAFSGVEHTLERLWLESNRLTTLEPDALTTLAGLHDLKLANNPWNCSCRLRPLKQWLVSQNVPSLVPAVCKYPPRLTGKPWDKLTDDDFACQPTVKAVESPVYTVEGSNVSMSCEVKGNPIPKVEWYWNDKPIANMSGPPLNRRKMYIVDTTKTKTSLIIYAVDVMDVGTFHCSAWNKAGRSKANVTLEVRKRNNDNRFSTMLLVGGGVLGSIMVLLSFFLLCMAKKPNKDTSQNRRDSYEKIELDKKTEENSHSRIKGGYKGLPSSEEQETTNSMWDQFKSNSKPNLCDLSASELCRELGVTQHIMRKEVLPGQRGRLYTTAEPAPDLVTGDDIPARSSKQASTTSVTSTTRFEEPPAKYWEGTSSKFKDRFQDLGASQLQDSALSKHREGNLYGTLPRRSGRSHSSQSPLLASSSSPTRSSNLYRFSDYGCEKKSASSLNLYYSGASSGRTSNYWHHPSLPSSPTRHSLDDRSRETPLLNLLGSSDYDYHSTQLDRFLEEYRSLQEQLTRMKEKLTEASVYSSSLTRRSADESRLFSGNPARRSLTSDRPVRYWAQTDSLYGDFFSN